MVYDWCAVKDLCEPFVNVLLLQCQMVVQDRLEKEKGMAKNAVESYVYDMRSKLYGELERFITEEVCTTFYQL